METQADTAKRMYDARAHQYNDSWHPSFTSYAVSYLDVQPGWNILDLASGTGLVSFNAAKAVGSTGSVIGVDVSDGMLSMASQELDRLRLEHGGFDNVQFFKHDITKLDKLEALRGKQFDAITCCSALVLLPDPYKAVNSWTAFLKPGGKLVVDVTHPRNQPAGIAIELVNARLGLPPPSTRIWSQSEDDIKILLETAGLKVEDVHLQPQTKMGTKFYRIDEGESIWNDMIAKEHAKSLRQEEVVDRAKTMFLEEWKLLANKDGNVEDVDGVFIAKAAKINDTPPVKPLMAGSCACSAVKWHAAITPLAICHCFCVPCRKVSGGPFLSMMEFPAWAITFEPTVTQLRSIALTPHARRSFCDKCGTTLTFQHFRALQHLEVAMGSLDEDSLTTISIKDVLDRTKRNNWCWMKSKVGWFDPPEDGLKRCETTTSHAAISVYKDD
jgi:ubiquinone/menaquinone biosynthesis C-methylase UbiE